MSITDSSVVELRQYTLKPGARDTLVEIFEAEFVESQEELGTAIGGLFHDRDDPDRFVWMRGFASMEARKDALDRVLLRRARRGRSTGGRQRDDDRQRRRPAAPADRPAAPAGGARPSSAGRGDRHLRRVGRSSPSGSTNPATAPATGSPRTSAPASPTPSARTSPPGAPNPPRTPSPPCPSAPTTPSSGRATFGDEASYAAALAALGQRPRLAAYPRRARPPRRHHPDPPPPPHRPVLPRSAGIVRYEKHLREPESGAFRQRTIPNQHAAAATSARRRCG